MILDTSDEAAKLVTLELWQSSKGNLYMREDAARYDGCTHRACKVCGAPASKYYTLCNDCRFKSDQNRYENREKIAWDYETLIYSETLDKYIFDADDLDQAIADFDQPLIDECIEASLRLVSCEPVYLSQIPEDYWCDDLPDEITEALKKFNLLISKQKPVSWSIGKYRVTL